MKVLKKDGSKQDFDISKIISVLHRANKKNEQDEMVSPEGIKYIADEVSKLIFENIETSEIEKIIETKLIEKNMVQLARNYIIGCYDKRNIRHRQNLDDSILGILDESNEEVTMENANKNPSILSTQRDYMAGEISKDIVDRLLYSKEIVDAHKEGIIHLHDKDYISMKMTNCELINLEDMLQNGTVMNGVKIEKPKSLLTACTIASQISLAVSSCSYGGQSMNLAHLAPFVDISRQKYIKELIHDNKELDLGLSDEQIKNISEKRLKTEIKNSVQTINYQWNTMSSANGQTPFVTLFMYLNDAKSKQEQDDLSMLIEEILNQRIKGFKNEKGVLVSQTFPKLIYVLDENNIYKDSEYYWLTELSAKCTAKRMVPDYISAKKMKELKGSVFAPMGCRSFLSIDEYGYGENGEPKYWGRYNKGVCTLNLPDIALSSKGDIDEFWKIFDDRMENLIRPALEIRHNTLIGTKSDVAPILWQHGAIARLKQGEVINELLYDGYSTISIGFAGLYETVKYMTGKSHTDESAKKFAMDIMQFMNNKADKWNDDENIGYSVYSTPLESSTYRLARLLKKRFGIVEGITDRDYITNSYHVPVFEEIDAFTKLSKEAIFQELSPGGAISYVECPNMQGNIPALMQLLKYMYDTNMYSEINTKSDYCEVCGFDGEMHIVKNENNKRIWECPNCHNRDQKRLSVVRRLCGYLGNVSKNGANQGRLGDIEDRVLHLT